MLQSPHDRLFKGIFGNPRHARQVLRTALPRSLARHIDFRTLRLQDGSYVQESLAMRYSDLLFSARAAGHSVRLYLLFEHQSEPDPLMAFRLMRYMTDIWHDFLDEHPNATRLPAIIPVVLHHGAGGWTSSTALEALYDLPDELCQIFAPVVPRFSFILDDLAAQTDQDIRRRAIGAIPTLVLWMFKHARDPALEGDRMVTAMREHIKDLLFETLRARTGLHALAMLMRYTLEVTGVQSETLGHFLETDIDPQAREILMTAAERLRQEGHQRGRAEGLAEGLAEGRRAVLIKLLGLRFGPLPAAVISRIEQADIEHLDAWSERVLSAESLSDVLD